MDRTSVGHQVSSYLAGTISAEELERNLPDGWDLDEMSDSEDRELTLRVMGHVAEFMADDLSEAELRVALQPYATWQVSVTSSADASLQWFTTPEASQSFGADREPVEEFA